MLSLKKLLQVLLITIFVSVLFFAYNIRENNEGTVENTNEIPTKQALIHSDDFTVDQKGISFIVVGEQNRIKENIISLFEQMHIKYKNADFMESATYHQNSIIIFCNEVISEQAELRELSSFVEAGGKIILAAGLAEGNEDSYLYPMIGIIEKSVRENYNKLIFKEGFLTSFYGEMGLQEYVFSSYLKIKSEAEIYVLDSEKDVPAIYSYPYGDGESLVLNINLLENPSNMGVLIAGIGEITEQFIYPVLGIKSIYLDNFPIVTYTNDKVCMKLYGRNTQSFVMDIVWPEFQNMGIRQEIKYTSGIEAISDDTKTFPELNKELFYAMGKSAMQFDGEITITGSFQGGKEIYYNETFMDGFKEVFPNYQIYGFSITENNSNFDDFNSIFSKVDSIKAIRYFYDGQSEEMFEVKDEYYTVPLLSQGLALSEQNKFTIASYLTAYGMISHGFDIDEFIAVDEGKNLWDENKRSLQNYEEEIFSKVKYLEPKTISEVENEINGYMNLEYYYFETEDGLELRADCFMKEQKFALKTEKDIKNITGGSFEKICKNYYMISLEEAIVHIEYK